MEDWKDNKEEIDSDEVHVEDETMQICQAIKVK